MDFQESVQAEVTALAPVRATPGVLIDLEIETPGYYDLRSYDINQLSVTSGTAGVTTLARTVERFTDDGVGTSTLMNDVMNVELLGAGGDHHIARLHGDAHIGGTDQKIYLGVVEGNTLIEGVGNHVITSQNHGFSTLRGNGHTFYSGREDNAVIVEEGDHTVFGGAGVDFLQGAGGVDTFFGGAGDNIIFGEGDDDFLFGGAGVEDLIGGAGDDFMFGEAGDDYLDGEAGNDVMIDGHGNDSLFSGSGADTFIFVSDNQFDRVSLEGDDPNTVLIFGLGAGAGDLQITGYDSNDRIFAYDGSSEAVNVVADVTANCGSFTYGNGDTVWIDGLG